MTKRRLFLSWYNDSAPERAAELAECLQKNVDSKIFDEICIFKEGSIPIKSDLIKTKEIANRPTYWDFFEWANELAELNDISIIANTDIYFDPAVNYTLPSNRECYALSRFDVQENGSLLPHHKPDSQDAWMFLGKIRPPRFSRFCLGMPGCDNRISFELGREGYKLSNPCIDFPIYHLHNTQIRRQTKADVIPPPYKMIPPIGKKGETVIIPEKIEFKSPPDEPKAEFSFKKVLHVGFPMPSLNRAFNDAAEVYEFIDWREMKAQELDAYIRQAVNQMEPDFVFFQIQTPNIINATLLQFIKSKGATVVNWTGDVRNPLPQWYLDMGIEFDLTLFSNMEDVEESRAKGIKSAFLQIGFEDDVYCPDGVKTPCSPIVFLGNNYGSTFPLSRNRHSMVQNLRAKYGRKFQVFGQGWNRADGNLMGDMQTEAQVYRNCEIAINYSHFDRFRYSSDRIFRILGSGAFCLSHHYKGIELDFIPGVHLETFKTNIDLMEKINFYLNNPSKRKAIAENGAKLAHEKYTWSNRLQELQYQINASK